MRRNGEKTMPPSYSVLLHPPPVRGRARPGATCDLIGRRLGSTLKLTSPPHQGSDETAARVISAVPRRSPSPISFLAKCWFWVFWGVFLRLTSETTDRMKTRHQQGCHANKSVYKEIKFFQKTLNPAAHGGVKNENACSLDVGIAH